MKNMTSRVKCAAAVAGFMILTGSAVEVDGIVAKVGGDTILKSDVMLEMRRINAPANEYPRFLQELIDRKLILRAAGEAKMTMQEWVVENRVRDIIKRAFGGDRNKLMETLAAQKISYPEWYARMKDDMIVSAMRYNVIDKNAVATPSEMRKEYEENRDRYNQPGKVTVSVILLSPETVTNRATIAAALKEKDFGELAKAYSADSHAAEGGVWKDVTPEAVFKPEICEEIAKMPIGTVSHWIEIDGWSFLLRKDEETPGVQRTFTEAYDDIENNVRLKKAAAAYDEWVARLREEAYIKIY